MATVFREHVFQRVGQPLRQTTCGPSRDRMLCGDPSRGMSKLLSVVVVLVEPYELLNGALVGSSTAVTPLTAVPASFAAWACFTTDASTVSKSMCFISM